MSSTSSTAVITEEELKIIQEKKKKYEEAYAVGAANTQALAMDYFASFIGAMIGNITAGPPPPPPPGPPGPGTECGPDPDPNDEHIAHGGWGGDLGSPETWESVPMKDDPSLFKVVDKEGKNIAHKFATEAEADTYIKYHQCIKEKGDNDPDPVPPPPPGPVPPAAGTAGDYPYPAKGTPIQSTQRGPTTRHYASGKPDDRTIEKNCKGINFQNYMFVVDVTINGMAHDDTVSLKGGGHHMTGNGWYDHSVGVYTGKTGLGTEPDHPNTNLFSVKGPSIGDIRNKPIKIATVYYTKENKTELWTNFEASGWKKQCEGTAIDGLKPKLGDQETQLRIDGFGTGTANIPTIRSAIVLEI